MIAPRIAAEFGLHHTKVFAGRLAEDMAANG
jgi:hypothetical protein